MAKYSTSRRRAAKTSRRAAANGASRNGQLEPNLARAQRLVIKMMAIPGASGDEARIACFVIDQLRKAGASAAAIRTDQAHQKGPIDGNIGNLIFKLPGTTRKPRRLLMGHLDTVPICVGSQPVLRGKEVRSADPKTGLGGDNRAGAAVLLTTALEILKRDLPHPPLTFLWPVQEEIGLQGARYVRLGALGKPRLAFNWDGGGPAKLTIGATGGYRMRIKIAGLAAHAGGAPEEGISAIEIAAIAIAELAREGWHGAIRKGKSLGTSNVGVIQGGAATNVVTDAVEIRAEARSHDPVFRRRIVREIEQAFKRAARAVHNNNGERGAVRIESVLDYESFRLKPKEPCVQMAAEAVRTVGGEPELAIANGGLDANWLTKHGIPTVSLGCGQRNIHTVAEALNLADFHTACRIALRLATDVS